MPQKPEAGRASEARIDNFGKFLIGRDGAVLERFAPTDKPTSGKITRAIEKALARRAA